MSSCSSDQEAGKIIKDSFEWQADLTGKDTHINGDIGHLPEQPLHLAAEVIYTQADSRVIEDCPALVSSDEDEVESRTSEERVTAWAELSKDMEELDKEIHKIYLQGLGFFLLHLEMCVPYTWVRAAVTVGVLDSAESVNAVEMSEKQLEIAEIADDIFKTNQSIFEASQKQNLKDVLDFIEKIEADGGELDMSSAQEIALRSLWFQDKWDTLKKTEKVQKYLKERGTQAEPQILFCLLYFCKLVHHHVSYFGDHGLMRSDKVISELYNKELALEHSHTDMQLSHKQFKSHADSLYKTKHYKEAAQNYSAAIVKDFSNYDLYIKRAECWMVMQNFWKAYCDSRRAMFLDPTDYKAYFCCAQACQKLGRLQEALDCLVAVQQKTSLADPKLKARAKKEEDKTRAVLAEMVRYSLLLREGLEAYKLDNYLRAAGKYHAALKLLDNSNLVKSRVGPDEVIILRYAHAVSSVHQTGSRSALHEAFDVFQAMFRENLHQKFPLLRYGLACSYVALYRFANALPVVSEPLTPQVKKLWKEHCWPRSDQTIEESKLTVFMEKMRELKELCEHPPEPDAVCSEHADSHGKNIYRNSPDFNGLVSLNCYDKCHLYFHPACWKEFKRTRCGLGDSSDKEVLDKACPTPDCGSFISRVVLDRPGKKLNEYVSERRPVKDRQVAKVVSMLPSNPDKIAKKVEKKELKRQKKSEKTVEQNVTEQLSNGHGLNELHLVNGQSQKVENMLPAADAMAMVVLQKEDEDELKYNPFQGQNRQKKKKEKIKREKGSKMLAVDFKYTEDEEREATRVGMKDLVDEEEDYLETENSWAPTSRVFITGSGIAMLDDFAVPQYLKAKVATIEESFSSVVANQPRRDVGLTRKDLEIKKTLLHYFLDFFHQEGPQLLDSMKLKAELEDIPEESARIIKQCGGIRAYFELHAEFTVMGNCVGARRDAAKVQAMSQGLSLSSYRPSLGHNYSDKPSNEISSSDQIYSDIETCPVLSQENAESVFNIGAEHIIAKSSNSQLLGNFLSSSAVYSLGNSNLSSFTFPSKESIVPPYSILYPGNKTFTSETIGAPSSENRLLDTIDSELPHHNSLTENRSRSMLLMRTEEPSIRPLLSQCHNTEVYETYGVNVRTTSDSSWESYSVKSDVNLAFSQAKLLNGRGLTPAVEKEGAEHNGLLMTLPKLDLGLNPAAPAFLPKSIHLNRVRVKDRSSSSEALDREVEQSIHAGISSDNDDDIDDIDDTDLNRGRRRSYAEAEDQVIGMGISDVREGLSHASSRSDFSDLSSSDLYRHTVSPVSSSSSHKTWMEAASSLATRDTASPHKAWTEASSSLSTRDTASPTLSQTIRTASPALSSGVLHSLDFGAKGSVDNGNSLAYQGSDSFYSSMAKVTTSSPVPPQKPLKFPMSTTTLQSLAKGPHGFGDLHRKPGFTFSAFTTSMPVSSSVVPKAELSTPYTSASQGMSDIVTTQSDSNWASNTFPSAVRPDENITASLPIFSNYLTGVDMRQSGSKVSVSDCTSAAPWPSFSCMGHWGSLGSKSLPQSRWEASSTCATDHPDTNNQADWATADSPTASAAATESLPCTKLPEASVSQETATQVQPKTMSQSCGTDLSGQHLDDLVRQQQLCQKLQAELAQTRQELATRQAENGELRHNLNKALLQNSSLDMSLSRSKDHYLEKERELLADLKSAKEQSTLSAMETTSLMQKLSAREEQLKKETSRAQQAENLVLLERSQNFKMRLDHKIQEAAHHKQRALRIAQTWREHGPGQSLPDCVMDAISYYSSVEDRISSKLENIQRQLNEQRDLVMAGHTMSDLPPLSNIVPETPEPPPSLIQYNNIIAGLGRSTAFDLNLEPMAASSSVTNSGLPKPIPMPPAVSGTSTPPGVSMPRPLVPPLKPPTGASGGMGLARFPHAASVPSMTMFHHQQQYQPQQLTQQQQQSLADLSRIRTPAPLPLRPLGLPKGLALPTPQARTLTSPLQAPSGLASVSAARGAASMSALGAERPTSSFERIVQKLQKIFPTLDRDNYKRVIMELRQAHNGSLSGLDLDMVVKRVTQMLIARGFRPQGPLMQDSEADGSKNNNSSTKSDSCQTVSQLVRPPPGLSAAWGMDVIEVVPVGSHFPEAPGIRYVEEEEDPCAICCEELTSKPVQVLACAHRFHDECIRTWFKHQTTCPKCRTHTLLLDEFPALR